MKIAVLIFAHKYPDQLNRLIDLMQNPAFTLFIHLDKAANINDFNSLDSFQNVKYIKNRTRVRWATFSMVTAIINSLIEITNSSKFDYILLVSGQDLPIHHPHSLIEHLNENYGNEFISCLPFSKDNDWWKDNLPRVNQYNFQNWKIKGKYKIQKIINSILPERSHPEGYILAGNSSWFCITQVAALYILNVFNKDKKYINYFKYVWGPDEIIFSTILYNSRFRDKIVENLTFVDWSIPNDGHPNILKKTDFNKIINSGKYFARKFDSTVDDEIIEMIINRIKISLVINSNG